MDEWLVQKDGEISPLSEAKLREELRSGDLSGTELSRAPGESGWHPLYTRPVFSEEVPHSGDPGRAARWRKVRGLVVHLAAFAAVMVFLGMPFWGLFWGIGVVAHLLATLPSVVGLVRPPEVPEVVHEAQAEAQVEDDFLRALADTLAALERAEEPAEGLEAEARALHERRLALAVVVRGADTHALSAERDQALAEAEAAADVLDHEAHTRRALAISEHLGALEEAHTAHRRLVAQEQALVHQLAGLRLSLARRAAGEAEPEAAQASLRLLRETLQAESEVDDHLARARAHQRERTR